MKNAAKNIRIAAIQAAPVFLDAEATVDKACDLIREAGANDADLAVFPEAFVPGYPVWAWYRHGGNRPTDARYEIHHTGGVTTVSISQEVHGMTWRYLGEYYFEAGREGYVTLLSQSDDCDPSQAIIADAIRFGGGLGSIERGEPASTSSRPRWEEAAKYWAQYQGAPPEVHSG